MQEINIDKHHPVIIIEPCFRGTAPAIAAAAHFLSEKYNRCSMLILPVDHIAKFG
jgi:mannose-1-phosphate guanylyltransferase